MNPFFFMGCIEASKPLPPSRLIAASTGSMIQYSSLRAFLITRGEPQTTLLWQVQEINNDIKRCALEQIPNHTKVLLIDSNPLLAQQYLQISSSPIPFQCTQ